MMTGRKVISDQGVVLRPIPTEALGPAAVLLAMAMRDNPLHCRVFGAEPGRRQNRLLSVMTPLLGHVAVNGQVIGAWEDGHLLGVLGLMPPGRCKPGLRHGVGLAGRVLRGNPPFAVMRVARWLTVWARHDPVFPHWHFGPLGVRPENRRRGIARGLMQFACARLDDAQGIGWLETDLPQNVAFYESLGFVVAHHRRLLGVDNWFMIRPAGGGSAD